MKVIHTAKIALMRRLWWILHRNGFEVRRTEHWCWPDQVRLAGAGSRIIFDVGANGGETAARYLELFPDATVHCFEPMPDYVQFIRNRFATEPRVGINECALSARNGTAEFHVNVARDTSSLLAPDVNAMPTAYSTTIATEKKIQVRTETVTAYCGAKNIATIDILKMDVQGGELDILKGAAEMLASGSIKIIYTEVFFTPMYQDQPLFAAITSYLAGHGYSLHALYNSTFNGHTGRLQWADAIFVSPALAAQSTGLLRQTHTSL